MEKKVINGWETWEIENSSRVSKIEYKKTSLTPGGILSQGDVILTFKPNGERYIYHEVPRIMVLNAINSSSVGRALNVFIKDKTIKYEKLED